jgi:hypothetical protein
MNTDNPNPPIPLTDYFVRQFSGRTAAQDITRVIRYGQDRNDPLRVVSCHRIDVDKVGGIESQVLVGFERLAAIDARRREREMSRKPVPSTDPAFLTFVREVQGAVSEQLADGQPVSERLKRIAFGAQHGILTTSPSLLDRFRMPVTVVDGYSQLAEAARKDVALEQLRAKNDELSQKLAVQVKRTNVIYTALLRVRITGRALLEVLTDIRHIERITDCMNKLRTAIQESDNVG